MRNFLKDILGNLKTRGQRIDLIRLGAPSLRLLTAGMATVSLVIVIWYLNGKQSTPNFTEYDAGDERKEAFFSYFLPLINQQNQELLALRNEVQASSNAPEQLSFFQRRKIEDIAQHYNVEDFSTENPDAWDLLMRRVDIVPPSLALAQAANESAWGTSRFATQGNNFYGHWCFEAGCGIVPAARDETATHEVAKFDSAEEAVEKYMHNLNQHPAYAELRTIRASLRKKEQPITGLKIIRGLGSYSERGLGYIRELSAMIRFNELSRYDTITDPTELRNFGDNE